MTAIMIGASYLPAAFLERLADRLAERAGIEPFYNTRKPDETPKLRKVEPGDINGPSDLIREEARDRKYYPYATHIVLVCCACGRDYQREHHAIAHVNNKHADLLPGAPKDEWAPPDLRVTG